jgi:hypothetical protein
MVRAMKIAKALLVRRRTHIREIKYIEEELIELSKVFKLDVNLDDDIVRRIK